MSILGLLPLIIMVVALVDLITRPDADVRHMPKLVWLLIVVFMPLIGGVLWFTMGRRYGQARPAASHPAGRGRQKTQRVTTAARPAPAAAPRRSTEEQLADLEREIKYYEAQDRIRQLEDEIRKKREGEA
ncbi:MAG TPA: PLD nuclease N-terminal domain-containing protein [Microbacteriaceae bacterium]|nr:PLD nuclease N-terminal domain-containing protein [Microbacteriaceae bacterium]